MDRNWIISGDSHVLEPEDLFEKADFITLHIPANESTKGLVNKDLLDHAKSLSLLNFARHEVIDSQAILDSLEEQTLINFVTDFPCLLYTSPSPRDGLLSRMPSSA